jgi:hypothetical protein
MILMARKLVIPLFVGLVVGCSLIAIQAMVYSSLICPNWLSTLGVVILVVAPAGSLIGIICSLPMLLFKKARKAALKIMPYCFSVISFLGIAAYFSAPLRGAALHRVIERGKPLVTAISGYEKSCGHPPNKLTQLVPTFIDHIPETGFGDSPNFEYTFGDDVHVPACLPKYGATEEDVRRKNVKHTDAWMLAVQIPSLEVIEIEQMYYLPTHHYDLGEGGEVIDGWAIDSCPWDAF